MYREIEEGGKSNSRAAATKLPVLTTERKTLRGLMLIMQLSLAICVIDLI